MKKGCLWAVGVFFFLTFLGFILSDEDESTTTESTAESTQGTVKKKKNQKTWDVYTYVDEMTDKKTVTKSLVSDNSHEFEFPYSGGSSLTLKVRYMDNSNDVILKLEQGQIIGNEFDGSNYVNVRFDNDKPQKFFFVGSADYSTDIAFLKRAKLFIERAKTAKTIKIDLPVFQEGRPLYTFTVDVPLEWEY